MHELVQSLMRLLEELNGYHSTKIHYCLPLSLSVAESKVVASSAVVCLNSLGNSYRDVELQGFHELRSGRFIGPHKPMVERGA